MNLSDIKWWNKQISRKDGTAKETVDSSLATFLKSIKIRKTHKFTKHVTKYKTALGYFQSYGSLILCHRLQTLVGNQGKNRSIALRKSKSTAS